MSKPWRFETTIVGSETPVTLIVHPKTWHVAYRFDPKTNRPDIAVAVYEATWIEPGKEPREIAIAEEDVETLINAGKRVETDKASV